MKKSIIALCLLSGFTFQLNGQTINDVPMKDINIPYVQIVGRSKFLSTKLTIEIDFGQADKLWTNKEFQVRDENGKKMEFNTMIDALNFMSKNGYEFVQAYAFAVENQNVYHYLLRKKTQ